MASPDNSIKNNGAHITKFKTDLTNQEISQLSVVDGTYYNPKVVNNAIDFSLRQQNSKTKNQRQIAATLGANLLNSGVTVKNTASLMREGLTDLDRFSKTEKNIIDAANYGKNIKARPGSNPYVKMKRAKENILGVGDMNYEPIVFPLDLLDNTPSYIQLEFFIYKRPDPKTEGGTTSVLKLNLPMPQNFSQIYNIRLDQKDTGFYGDVVNNTLDIGRDIAARMRGESVTGNVTLESMGNLIKGAGLRGMMMGVDTLDLGVSALAGADNNSASGIMTQFMGAVPNPHASVFFKGMDLRQWSWVWKLVPRNKDESIKLAEMLGVIRERVLPYNDGSILHYPDMILPSVKGDENGVMADFKLTMVKNLTINYTPEGGSAFFFDGSPVAVELTMEFQEIQQQTSTKNKADGEYFRRGDRSKAKEITSDTSDGQNNTGDPNSNSGGG